MCLCMYFSGNGKSSGAVALTIMRLTSQNPPNVAVLAKLTEVCSFRAQKTCLNRLCMASPKGKRGRDRVVFWTANGVFCGGQEPINYRYELEVMLAVTNVCFYL